MDTALQLLIDKDNKVVLSDTQIDEALKQSKVVQKLTKDYEENNLFIIFRAICLSEIPYSERLPYTKQLLSYISTHISTPEGFSYTEKINYIVPCYNAMLLEAYVNFGLANSDEVQIALQWIKNYQVFGRNEKTTWSYDGICKHGGCMKSIPCYIGIGKTIRALITYSEAVNHTDVKVEELINQGTRYMLRHHMFQRMSNYKPISAHITDIMFPQAYMLTVMDLVYIVGKRNLWKDSRTNHLKQLIDSKMIDIDTWKIDYIYSHRGYKAIDTRRKDSKWIHYLMERDYKTNP